MATHNSTDNNGTNRILAEAMRLREQKEKGYRARALKLFPPICAYCGREFEGTRIKELTVHHKDHNHDNNPADGSNWELLCIYCHENQHARQDVADAYDKEAPGGEADEASGNRPFANLGELLKSKKT
jgi:hypothetical protein